MHATNHAWHEKRNTQYSAHANPTFLASSHKCEQREAVRLRPDNDDNALRPPYGGTLPTSWTRTAAFASNQRRVLRNSNRWNQRWRAGYNCCHAHFALHTRKQRTVVCYEQSATGNFIATTTNMANWHLPQRRS